MKAKEVLKLLNIDHIEFHSIKQSVKNFEYIK